jgi:hypothetical protein
MFPAGVRLTERMDSGSILLRRDDHREDSRCGLSSRLWGARLEIFLLLAFVIA